MTPTHVGSVSEGADWGYYLRSIESYPPPDWVPGPPTFIGIGTQKAGTTWWYRLIEAHPQFFSRHHQKERHYFTRFGHREYTADDALRYSELFYRPMSGGVTGEWTPGYMSEFWVAPLMAQAAPDAKLLVLIRDPIARYLSGVRHVLGVGGASLKVAQRDSYERGRYFEELRPFLLEYPSNQIQLIQFEHCLADPRAQLRRTYEFLGMDPSDFVPPTLNINYNELSGPRFNAPDEVIDYLVELYAPDVAALAQTWPDLDLDVWPRFR